LMIPQSAFRNPQLKMEDMIAFIRDALGLSESVSVELSPLEGRGSDRTFFRLKWGRKDSAILVHYDPKRIENTYYADIAAFLRDIHVPAPRLIRHDTAACLIVMEDLGDTDLWSLRETPWETRRALYQETLTIVHRLHSFPEKDFPSDRVRLMAGFGPELYRWEHDYFKDHFVRDVCGIELELSFEQELKAELSSLAERLAAAMPTSERRLVHRDLQSQNVMIRDGEPFLIDFQGMRFGSPFYDLGSLLCDPYVDFSDSERDELLSYYYGLWSPASGTPSKVDGSKWDLDWEAFRNTFWIASVQRLMQALGAYGFLGLKKGLTACLEHIPSGLGHLQLVASHVTSLPRLLELSQTCQRVLDEKR
jgi:aminoglycoside/choline kinase family phosphotransferase